MVQSQSFTASPLNFFVKQLTNVKGFYNRTCSSNSKWRWKNFFTEWSVLLCVYWDWVHPDNENQTDGRTETVQHFQIQPIIWLVQNIEISTFSLWYLRDYGVAYQLIVKLKTVSTFGAWIELYATISKGSWLVYKIHEKKSCVRVSLVNIHRQSVWCRVFFIFAAV